MELEKEFGEDIEVVSNSILLSRFVVMYDHQCNYLVLRCQ